MVAEHEIGRLVNSFVRVPGSGFDRNAEDSCLDLGKISSFAARINVPPSLPIPGRKRKIQKDEEENPAKPFKKSKKMTEVQFLQQQCDILQKKNKELERKLLTIHQVFKDKKRLTSVVKRLGINVVSSSEEKNL